MPKMPMHGETVLAATQAVGQCDQATVQRMWLVLGNERGRADLRRLLRGFYTLSDEQRAALLTRLEEVTAAAGTLRLVASG